MSEQMRTQIRGLGKAKQNTQDGVAALQIAEGGLAEITNIMQRQRELAVQSATDTLTSTERFYLDEEFQELTKEIKRISETTDYNGKNMLNFTTDPNTSLATVDRGNVYETRNVVTIEEDAASGTAEERSIIVEGSIDTKIKYKADSLNGEYEAGSQAEKAANAYNEIVTQFNELRQFIDGFDDEDSSIGTGGVPSRQDIYDHKDDILAAINAIVNKIDDIESLFSMDTDMFLSSNTTYRGVWEFDDETANYDIDDAETAIQGQINDAITAANADDVIADRQKVQDIKDAMLFGDLKNALYDLKHVAEVEVGDVMQNAGSKAASDILHVGANYS